MEVHLPHNQEVLLNELAAQTGRPADVLVQEAVAQMLVQNERSGQTSGPARKSRLWELRKGLTLGDLSIKELIEEGRE